MKQNYLFLIFVLFISGIKIGNCSKFFGIEYYNDFNLKFNFIKSKIDSSKTDRKNKIIIFKNFVVISNNDNTETLYFNFKDQQNIFFLKKKNGEECCKFQKGSSEFYILDSLAVYGYGMPYDFKLYVFDPYLKLKFVIRNVANVEGISETLMGEIKSEIAIFKLKQNASIGLESGCLF